MKGADVQLSGPLATLAKDAESTFVAWDRISSAEERLRVAKDTAEELRRTKEAIMAHPARNTGGNKAGVDALLESINRNMQTVTTYR